MNWNLLFGMILSSVLLLQPVQAQQTVPQKDGNLVEIEAIPKDGEKNDSLLKLKKSPRENASSSQIEPPLAPPQSQPGVQRKQDGTSVPTNTPLRRGKAKMALTLAGGGARGAAHVGVLKVLDAEGIKPDFVAGSSIGAIIGSLYAAGVPASRIEEILLTKEFRKAFFPTPRGLKILSYAPRYLAVTMLTPWKPQVGLYSGKSLANFVRKHLPEGVENIEDLKIPFAATAVNLINTKAVWMTKGSIAEAVRASSSVPFIYRPVKVNGSWLVDGGLRTNLPTELAESVGAPVVVAVKLHSYLEKVDQSKFDSIFEYGDRLISILMAEIENKAVTDADVLVEPEVDYMTMHSFDKEDVAKAIAEGERAARKALPKIRELLRDSKTASTPETEPKVSPVNSVF